MKPIQLLSNALVLFFLSRLSNAATSTGDAGFVAPVQNTYPSPGSGFMTRLNTRPTKRGIDAYRFFGFGLGKRNQVNPETKWYRPQYVEPLANPRQTEPYLLPDFSHSPNRRNLLQRILTHLLPASNVDDYTNRAKLKRVPEVYQEEFYPVQAGKQQMEVKIDNSLQNATHKYYSNTDEDYPDSTYSDEGRINPFRSTSEQSHQLVTGISETQPVNKRWWAASRLASLRIPNSGRTSRRRWGRKLRIDPALYFLGLGR